MEAQRGIEPLHRGFADRRVSTSPLRHKIIISPRILEQYLNSTILWSELYILYVITTKTVQRTN